MPLKRIVVVFKKNIYAPVQETPPFERLRDNSQNLYTFFQRAEEKHLQSWQMLLQILEKFALPLHIHTRNEKDMPTLNADDLIISFGGDGTFLYASRFITNSLLLGINSSPQTSVGHFCRYALPLHSKEIEKAIALAIEGKAKAKKIPRLQIRINGEITGQAVLNDILVCEKIPVITSRYVLHFAEEEQDQKSSGIWIATASGSSAAYQSAGGTPFQDYAAKTILQQDSKQKTFLKKQFAFIVRELYQPQKTVKEKRITNGMVQEGENFSVVSGMKSGQIFLDGNPQAYPFTIGDKLEVEFHPHSLLSL